MESIKRHIIKGLLMIDANMLQLLRMNPSFSAFDAHESATETK